MEFAAEVAEAQHEFIGLQARHVRREGQHAIGDAMGDERRRQPPTIDEFVAPLAEDEPNDAGIGGGVLFQQPGAVFVESNFDGKAAGASMTLAATMLASVKMGCSRDGDEHGIGA